MNRVLSACVRDRVPRRSAGRWAMIKSTDFSSTDLQLLQQQLLLWRKAQSGPSDGSTRTEGAQDGSLGWAKR